MTKTEKTKYIEFLKTFDDLKEAALNGAIFMLENSFSNPETLAFAWVYHQEERFERQDMFSESGRREVIFMNSQA